MSSGNHKLHDLANSWRAEATSSPAPDAAAVWARCADELTWALNARDQHPCTGVMKVGELSGPTQRIDVLLGPNGLYGLEVWSTIPGQQRVASIPPDGRREAVPKQIIFAMKLPKLMKEITRLTADWNSA